MSDGGAETWATGFQAVVGEEMVGCIGDADSVLGGRMEGGGGGDRWDGNIDGRIIRWEYTVVNVNLVTGTNAPIFYAPGLELHHSIMIMLRGNRGRLERERGRKQT